MGEHSLDLPLAHRLEQPARDDDVALCGNATRGEGVRRGIVDDVQRRRCLHPGGDRDGVDEVVDLRPFLPRDGVGAGELRDHRAARDVREDAVHDAHDEDEAAEASPSERVGSAAERDDQEPEGGEDEDGAEAVGPDLLLQGHGWKLTSGSSRSPASAAKNSRFTKPKMPARITAGNVWIELLKRSTVAL